MNRRKRKKLARRLVDAAAFGTAAEVAALLRAGAHPEAADAEGTTPLYAAAVQGSADTLRLLLEAGAAPDRESGYGAEGTPLCAAACWGHEEAVRELLTHGADPNLAEDGGAGRTPLDWAGAGPYPGTVDLLRAAGARERA